ncbi:MAG TPA: hypothetical protein VFS94_06440 [Gemmatimonadales bacterium]|nr:hypothetical protein [Gemmatimonadales bacterium]
MRPRHRISGTEMVALGLGGFLAGALAGIALSAWTGGINRERISRAARRVRTPALPTPPAGSDAVRAAQDALLGDPVLATLGLRVAAQSGSGVELRGWVASRALRARAARVLVAAGIGPVSNGLLVRGEDDRDVIPMMPRGDQHA